MHNPSPRAGLFLVLEGSHGAGKSTQARRLAAWLTDQGYDVCLTHEIGGSVVGDQIRRLVQAPEHKSLLAEAPKSLLFLVLAARNLHVRRVIQPAIDAGCIVVCERFVGSTYAIQNHADGLDWDVIHPMAKYAAENLAPDLTILLDISAPLGMERKKSQGTPGFWEMRAVGYHTQVAQGFRDAAHRFPGWRIVDAQRDEETVFSDIQRHIHPLLDGLADRTGSTTGCEPT